MLSKLVSSMEKIYPERELQAEVYSSGQAFQGERLNFQVAYRWEGVPAWGQAEVESELEGVSLRLVELEPGEYVCPENGDDNYQRRSPGLFPDILKPLEGDFRLYPGQWRALWVSIDTREEAPGEYPVTVRIRVDGKVVGEEHFLFHLLPARLPEQKLVFTQWMHTDCIAQWYGVEVFSERWWELVERYVRFGAEHGINMLLTPLFTPPLDTLEGGERLTVQLVDVHRKKGKPEGNEFVSSVPEERKPGGRDQADHTLEERDWEARSGPAWEFGYDRLERWIAMCQRCGIRYLEASHLFTQWGAVHAPKIMAEVDGRLERVFGWETDSLGAEYEGFLRAFLLDLTGFLRRMGLEGKVFFHVSDEPSREHLERYGRLSRLVQELTPGFPKMDALSDYDFYEEGLVEVPVCGTSYIAPFLEHNLPHLWAYYCCSQAVGVSNRFLAMPGARNRCIGLQLYHGKIEGFLHWGHNFWMKQFATGPIDPYRVSDAGGGFPAGDAFSVYPGPEGPVASVGLELFLEALQDLRALQFAEALSDRETVEGLYADVAYKGFAVSARRPGEVLAVRQQVDSLICSLAG